MNPDRDRSALVAFLALSAFACGSGPAPTEAPSSAASVDYDIAAIYSFDNRSWKVILVEPGVAQEGLAELAKQLVASFPENSFRIVDDDSQLDTYLEWRLNPDTEEVVKPEAWINEHHLATIRRIRTERGLELQLRGGPAHPTHAGRKILGLGS